MRAVLIVLIFFVLGALLIISNNNLALYKPENLQKFKIFYVFWLEQLYFNVQSVTGHVVEQNWIPESNGNLTVNQNP